MTGASDSAGLRTMVNVRDLGRLPAASGGWTRSGVLLRGDAPYRGDSERRGAKGWPPAVVIDLRGGREAAATGYRWPDGVDCVSNPLFSGARLDRAVERPLIDVYRDVMARAAERVTGAVNRYSLTGATFVHCAAGKDRTGIVVATTLALAGVAPEFIVADYERTELAIARVHERMRARNQLPAGVDAHHQIFRSPRDAIDLVLNTLDSAAGGPWGWFAAHGGNESRMQKWLAHFVDGTETKATTDA